MNQQVIAAVIQNGDRYLVCRRPPHKQHGGLWEFPGGKLEADEDFLAAAKRELREELGIEVSEIGKVRFSRVDQCSGFTINFIDVTTYGAPQALEHTELKWCTAAELQALELAPSDKEFADGLNSSDE